MASERLIDRLHTEIEEVCPIEGVSVSRNVEPPLVRIDFLPGATQNQKDAAAAVVAAFDWSDEAQEDWEHNLNPEKKSLLDTAIAAVGTIDSYLDIADTATNVQVRSQVKFLSQAVRRIIVRLVQID